MIIDEFNLSLAVIVYETTTNYPTHHIGGFDEGPNADQGFKIFMQFFIYKGNKKHQCILNKL